MHKCVFYECVRSSSLLLVRKLHSGYHKNALRGCYNRDFYYYSNLCLNTEKTAENSMKLRGFLKDTYYSYKDEI